MDGKTIAKLTFEEETLFMILLVHFRLFSILDGNIVCRN